jgi:hypothetical protein
VGVRVFERSLSDSRRRWFVGGLLLFFLAVSVQYTFKVAAHRSAIDRFLGQLRQVDSTADVYQRFTYPHPPLLALLLKQMAAWPPLAAALFWFYFKVGLTVLALLWVFRLAESPGRPFPLWAKVLTVGLSLRPIMGDLMHGNINLLVLFLVVAFLYAYHRGRDVLAGILLGLAIVCRLTPGLFVPYFLWKRAWKTLAGCVLGLVLFTWVVPSCLVGVKENAHELSVWADHWIWPYLVKQEVNAEHNNQSLPGLVFRLTTHSPSFVVYPDNQYTPSEYHNWVDLDPAWAGWFVKGCMAVFAGLIVWSCRTPTSPRANWRLAAEFSLVALGMLLFSERTWKHHCVLMLLPFAVLCYYLAACRPGPGLRRYLIITLAAVALLMTSTSTGLSPSLNRLGKLAQVYGAYVWANLLLVAALVTLLRQRQEPSGEPFPL